MTAPSATSRAAAAAYKAATGTGAGGVGAAGVIENGPVTAAAYSTCASCGTAVGTGTGRRGGR